MIQSISGWLSQQKIVSIALTEIDAINVQRSRLKSASERSLICTVTDPVAPMKSAFFLWPISGCRIQNRRSEDSSEGKHRWLPPKIRFLRSSAVGRRNNLHRRYSTVTEITTSVDNVESNVMMSIYCIALYCFVLFCFVCLCLSLFALCRSRSRWCCCC